MIDVIFFWALCMSGSLIRRGSVRFCSLLCAFAMGGHAAADGGNQTIASLHDAVCSKYLPSLEGNIFSRAYNGVFGSPDLSNITDSSVRYIVNGLETEALSPSAMLNSYASCVYLPFDALGNSSMSEISDGAQALNVSIDEIYNNNNTCAGWFATKLAEADDYISNQEPKSLLSLTRGLISLSEGKFDVAEQQLQEAALHNSNWGRMFLIASQATNANESDSEKWQWKSYAVRKFMGCSSWDVGFFSGLSNITKAMKNISLPAVSEEQQKAKDVARQTILRHIAKVICTPVCRVTNISFSMGSEAPDSERI
jgi:hypothetical protein